MQALTRGRKKPNRFLPYLLLFPCLFLFLAFSYFPFVKTIFLSFFLTDLKGSPIVFVGLENFQRIFASADFQNSLLISFKFAVLVGVPSVLIGFILALLAYEKGPLNRGYEVMYSLPMAVASVPAAAIWMALMGQGSGVLNWILRHDVNWLKDPRIALFSVAIVTVWLRMGVNFIFLLTGFRNVPVELMESARIDGANYFRRLFHVMIPMASPQIFFVVFLAIVNSFQSFGQIKVLTGGGPNYATNVLIYSIYRYALVENRFESACVQSLVLFLVIFLITRIQFLLEKKVVHYD